MKKVLLTLLTVIVALGLLAGAGYAGYRFGYQRATLTANINTPNNTPYMHGFVHPDVPMQNFGRELDRGFGRGMGFGMHGGMGFGFFGPLMFLGRILFWGLIIWFAYWLFTRSGWQLTRKAQTVAPAPVVEASASEEKES
ncbi:MAG: hypothetical protein QM730_16000 [Anaerolineales bacterium]